MDPGQARRPSRGGAGLRARTILLAAGGCRRKEEDSAALRDGAHPRATGVMLAPPAASA